MSQESSEDCESRPGVGPEVVSGPTHLSRVVDGEGPVNVRSAWISSGIHKDVQGLNLAANCT